MRRERIYCYFKSPDTVLPNVKKTKTDVQRDMPYIKKLQFRRFVCFSHYFLFSLGTSLEIIARIYFYVRRLANRLMKYVKKSQPPKKWVPVEYFIFNLLFIFILRRLIRILHLSQEAITFYLFILSVWCKHSFLELLLFNGIWECPVPPFFVLLISRILKFLCFLIIRLSATRNDKRDTNRMKERADVFFL